MNTNSQPELECLQIARGELISASSVCAVGYGAKSKNNLPFAYELVVTIRHLMY